MMATEAEVQRLIRLEAPKLGIYIWRNNNGAVTTADGRMVRFGLANNSAKLSKNIKSSDLIGITQVTIRPEDVGKTVAIFTSIEVKNSKWEFKKTVRELAQLKWLNLINKLGGMGYFVTKPEDLRSVND